MKKRRGVTLRASTDPDNQPITRMHKAHGRTQGDPFVRRQSCSGAIDPARRNSLRVS